MNSKQRKQAEADIYNQTTGQDRPSYSSFFHKQLYTLADNFHYRPFLNTLGKKYLTDKSVLILGAAANDVRFVSQFTTDFTANNISQHELDLVKQEFPKAKTLLADAEILKLKTKYDVAYCRSILHHLHPTQKIIKQIAIALKPGGHLFIASEPGYFHPFAYIGRRLTPSSTHTPGEKAYNYHKFESTISTHFNKINVRYFYILSIMLVIIPAKLPLLYWPCRLLLKPTIYLESQLAQFSIFKNLFWFTAGVYQKK